jgi:hypothetical protein
MQCIGLQIGKIPHNYFCRYCITSTTLTSQKNRVTHFTLTEFFLAYMLLCQEIYTTHQYITTN